MFLLYVFDVFDVLNQCGRFCFIYLCFFYSCISIHELCVCLLVCARVCTHIYLNVCVCVCVCMCLFVLSVCVCMCVCACVLVNHMSSEELRFRVDR